MSRGSGALLGLGMVAVLTSGACTSGTAAFPAARSTQIPQPALGEILAAYPDIELAPESQRVDIMRPTFSHPTVINNPLFPVSAQASVLHLGTKDGKPLRTEVTTLPYTRVIDWDGQRVEVLVSQYTLFLGGRIHEAAIDWYAQADDGAVWYFGENVFNYADGAVTDTNGTWLAGKDGPAALIMPGKPAVGQVFRPENIPGLVFEEVTVTAVSQTVDGPRGPVPGVLVAGEVHKDGTTSDKLFAPGYGEFRSSSATELEPMALVVPVDAVPGPVPAAVAAIVTSAGAIFDAAKPADWAVAGTQLEGLRTAWTTVRGGDVPAPIRELMDRGLTTLTTAVTARDPVATGQSAIDVLRLGLDLQLRHRPAPEVDLARMDVWARQLHLDAAVADQAGATGDVVALKYLRDRVLEAVGRGDLARIDSVISELEDAVGGPDFFVVTTAAAMLRDLVAGALTR